MKNIKDMIMPSKKRPAPARDVEGDLPNIKKALLNLNQNMSDLEKSIAFAVGIVPAALHLKYVDFKEFFRIDQQKGSSLSLGCNLAAGVAAAEAIKILCGRKRPRKAPWVAQFDPYLGKLSWRYLPLGNRGPLQRAKRYWLYREALKK